MVIHFSVLAVILICALIWEPSIKNNKISCIYNGQSYDYKSQLLPWLIVFGYITFLAAMRSNVNDTSAYINSFNRMLRRHLYMEAIRKFLIQLMIRLIIQCRFMQLLKNQMN